MTLLLELTANGSPDGATLGRGGFLTLEIGLVNAGPETVEIGSTLQPWWTRVEVLDDRDRPVYWPFEVLSRYPVEPVLHLGIGDSATLELGLAPEDFDREDSGDYGLRARSPDGAESPQLVVSLLEDQLTEEEAYAPDHLTALAVFLTKRGRHVDARKVIDALLSRGGASIGGLLLMGELQESQGDLQGAIGTYEHAERLYWQEEPDSNEPPDIIAARIVKLRRLVSS